MKKYLLYYGEGYYKIKDSVDYEEISWDGEPPIAIIELTNELINDIKDLESQE